MRFLRRSFVGLFLLSLTVGILAYAGQTVYSALQERWSQEDRVRPARERVFAVNVLPIEPGSIVPVMTSFGELRSLRTLEVRASASGAGSRKKRFSETEASDACAEDVKSSSVTGVSRQKN